MQPTTTPDLATYDVILVNTSGGKDSQVMLRRVAELAQGLGLGDRLVAVHADLGRVEWKGTKELAEQQATMLGVPRFEAVARPQGDLLDHIEERGMFPSSTARYCTSDHKRGQVAKVLTALAREHAARLAAEGQAPRPCRILNCMGFRAEESPARAKRTPFAADTRATNGRRTVDTWLPIFDLTTAEVWADIEASGVPSHPAYAAGMPRLSCCFCVLSSRSALVRSAQLNPELAAEYVALEIRIGHTFQAGTSMADIVAEAATSTVAVAADWAA